MTGKELLNIDLCSRLPYIDTMVRWQDEDYRMIDIGFGRVTLVKPLMSITAGTPLITEVKPYLRSIEDITDNEIDEIINELNTLNLGRKITRENFNRMCGCVWFYNMKEYECVSHQVMSAVLNFLYKHHFDVNGLIEKELAIKVTPENDPYKQ